MKAFSQPLALILLALFSASISIAQTDCGFDERHKALIQGDSTYKNSIKDLTNRLQQLNQSRGGTANAPMGVVYRIPVVVHVIHRGEAIGTLSNISDAQIQSAITSMSQFYRGTLGSSPDSEIEFELANLDPSCNATSGIIRVNGNSVANYSTNGLVTGAGGNELAVKNLSRWSNNRYYNIWIVSEINDNNGGGGVQGFAYFPGAGSTVDGAVMLYNAFGYDPLNNLGYTLKTATDENKTAIHELGHALGLYHSFEGDDGNFDGVADQCPANVNCLIDGDEICDTEPHRRSASNCPSGANICGGMLTNIVKNFMDYSSAACQDRFTAGQITRMRDAIALYRSTLTTARSLSLAYPATPYTGPVAACASSTGVPGRTSDYAGIMNIGINGTNFPSLTPRLDNVSSGYVNWTTDCHTLNELFRGGTYLFSATVYAVNDEQLKAWIDYNNNGIFEDATELIYDNATIPSHPTDYVTVSSWFTVPSSAAVNSVLRMRVIEEVAVANGGDPITDACYDPEYGQTEDFHIFLNSTLPIEVENFNGKRSGADVLLAWETSRTQNAKEFRIEKSFDGISFKEIGTIPAASNSTKTRGYTFLDRTLSQENNFYRLRMIDIDSKFEFSKIIMIKNPIVGKSPLRLLSNPVRENLDIQFGPVTGKVQLRLVDITGKTILTWNGENVSNRNVRVNLNGKNLNRGIYVLHATIQEKHYTEKVIIR